MHDENDDQGLDLDTGRHVEDARGYNSEESEEGIVSKVKNALGGDSDDPDDDDDADADVDDDELLDDSEDDDEVIVEDDENLI